MKNRSVCLTWITVCLRRGSEKPMSYAGCVLRFLALLHNLLLFMGITFCQEAFARACASMIAGVFVKWNQLSFSTDLSTRDLSFQACQNRVFLKIN